MIRSITYTIPACTMDRDKDHMCSQERGMREKLINSVGAKKLNDSSLSCCDSFSSNYKQEQQHSINTRDTICVKAHTQEASLSDALCASEEQHTSPVRKTSQLTIFLAGQSLQSKGKGILDNSTSSQRVNSSFEEKHRAVSEDCGCRDSESETYHTLVSQIPSVVVSDLSTSEESGPSQTCTTCSNGPTGDPPTDSFMDSGFQKSTRNPKIQNICESSSSLESNNGDLLSDTNEHTLISPRRSCDSAYCSSMDAGSNTASDEACTGFIIGSDDGNNLDSEYHNTNAGSSAEDSPIHKPHGSSLSVHCLRKHSPSPFSSSSSLASDKGEDQHANNSSLQVEAMPRKASTSSSCSLRSSLSFEESEEDFASSDENSNMTRRHSKVKAQISWTKIRHMVIWSPFMQSFKKKYPWVQLAGHAGNFQPGEEGCILKKYVEREAECLNGLSSHADLKGLAPTFHGVVEVNGEKYTRMQDLLLPFDCPSLMDCKMGIRTYLEDELMKAKVKPKLRKDMYQKMVEVAPAEPTDEERKLGAVTKPRYMQWREHISSTSNLGFRIEGIKKSDKEPSKDYKMTKTAEQVTDAFKYFIDNNVAVLKKYIVRLKEMCEALGKSDFFHSHEVIGSSLLFVHDPTGEANVWMIDFGKTTRLPNSQKLDHRSEWKEGNREDGYLFGMDNMVRLFEDILGQLMTQPNNLQDKGVNRSPSSIRKALRRQDARQSSGDMSVTASCSPDQARTS